MEARNTTRTRRKDSRRLATCQDVEAFRPDVARDKNDEDEEGRKVKGCDRRGEVDAVPVLAELVVPDPGSRKSKEDDVDLVESDEIFPFAVDVVVVVVVVAAAAC